MSDDKQPDTPATPQNRPGDLLERVAMRNKLSLEDTRTQEEKLKALLDHVRSLKCRVPLDWKFDRDEANER